MTRHLAVFLLGLPCLASGCAINLPGEINEKYREAIVQRHEHYTLKAGDTIDIELYGGAAQDDGLSQAGAIVLPDGRTDLFFMKSARVAGKTVPELRDEVRDKLAGEVDPVDIKIQVTPAEEKVFMVGEFETPGPVPLTVKMTLQEAISAAGGMRVTGDTDWALLRRPYLNPKNPDLFRIDLNDQLEDIFLLPGDQIVLSRTFLASVAVYMREYVFGMIPPGAWTLPLFF